MRRVKMDEIQRLTMERDAYKELVDARTDPRLNWTTAADRQARGAARDRLKAAEQRVRDLDVATCRNCDGVIERCVSSFVGWRHVAPTDGRKSVWCKGMNGARALPRDEVA